MTSGLKECGILQMLQAFPILYIPIFMHIGYLKSSEVVKAITSTEDSEGGGSSGTDSNNKHTFLCMFKCKTC